MRQNKNGNSYIVKRTGEEVLFDRERIFNAILSAVDATDTKVTKKALNNVVDDICYEISGKFTNFTPNVENIQDIVEKNLMKYEMFDVAKSYILYRANRSQLRESDSNNHIQKTRQHTLKIDCDDRRMALIVELVKSVQNGEIEFVEEKEE
jgi:anaerobic ribonucleoside-triphosphate reductase